MDTRTTLHNFHQVPRRNDIVQESVHDTYKAKDKLPEPTVCPNCGAVFHGGRWQWYQSYTHAHRQVCPACHRIQDNAPVGFLILHGSFFLAHREEIINLIHNFEEHERAKHPLKRIIDVKDEKYITRITTTHINFTHDIGEALQHTYQGDLVELLYSKETNLIDVDWQC